MFELFPTFPNGRFDEIFDSMMDRGMYKKSVEKTKKTCDKSANDYYEYVKTDTDIQILIEAPGTKKDLVTIEMNPKKEVMVMKVSWKCEVPDEFKCNDEKTLRLFIRENCDHDKTVAKVENGLIHVTIPLKKIDPDSGKIKVKIL